jgi:hypothetical protein
MQLPRMVLVEYGGELVAVVSARRVHIVAPWLLARPAGEPELRFVAFMCAYAGQVLVGAVSGPFSSRRAERWARGALIDDDRLTAVGPKSEAEAARDLNVPVEQPRLAREADAIRTALDTSAL